MTQNNRPSRKQTSTRLNRQQVIDYTYIAVFAVFVILVITAIITLSFRVVMGSVILGLGLGYLFYTGISDR